MKKTLYSFILTLVLTAPLYSANTQQQACFVENKYSLAVGAKGTVAADFNRDGHLDLAVAASGNTCNFVLFLGDSAGHMTPVNIHPGIGSQQIITGDFNHDSLPDVITLNPYNPPFISVFHGDGNGGFSTPDSIPVTESFNFEEPFGGGDFNNDGNIDLVFLRTYNGYPNVIAMRNSDSTGAFPGTEIIIDSLPLATYPGIACADLNGDNKTDLVVNNGKYVYFYAGNGNNTFASRVSFLAAPNFSEATGVFISDFNGDSKPDIAVGDIHTVTILTGDGTGNFIALPSIANIAGSGLTAADFNGDSAIDIIVTGTLAPGIINGDGTANFATPYDFSINEYNLSHITQGDFNNDGYMDFAATDGAVLHVFINSLPNITPVVIHVAVTNVTCNGASNGRATISAQSGVSPFTYYWNFTNHTNHITGLSPNNPVTGWIVAANGCLAKQTDTVTEPAALSMYFTAALPCGGDAALTANPIGGTAPYTYFWYNLVPAQHSQTADITAPGYYRVKVTDANNCSLMSSQIYVQTKPHLEAYTIYNTPGGSRSVTDADFDNNGVKDLVVAERTTGEVTILTGSSGGTFSVAGSYYACTNPLQILIADYNGDTFDDLAVFQQGPSDTIFFLYGNGNFTFANPVPVLVPVSYYNGGSKNAANADVNRDGKTDIIVGSLTYSYISVLVNNGTGTFTNDSLMDGTLLHIADIVTADVNNDSLPDIITADQQSDSVSVFLGYGNGHFQTPLHFATGGYPTFLSTADFNRDGNTDIAVVRGWGGTLQLKTLNGDGTGNFAAGTALSIGNITGLVCNDFDGDSIIDIALANSGAVIFPGAGNGTFNPAAYFTNSNFAPSSIVSADFNNDGLPDIAIADPTHSQTDVFLNCTVPTGISFEPAIGANFSLFPNPANEQLNINVDETLVGAQLTIFNSTGAQVKSVKLNTSDYKLFTSNFPTGVYVAEIKLQDLVLRRKWVKM